MPKRKPAGLVLTLLISTSWPVRAKEIEFVAVGWRLAVSLCAKCHVNERQD